MSFDDAKALLVDRKFDEAIIALRPFASAPEPVTGALFAYARALMGAERHSLAVWPLQRLFERPDAPAAVQRLYIAALLHGGADLEAVREATRLLEKNPNARAIRQLRVQGYQSTLDLEGAVEDMEILVDEYPGEARPVEQLLNLLIKIEDWDSAAERILELREMLQRDGVTPGTRAIFCATAARFEREHGETDLAEEQLRACLEESPADTSLVFSLVELLDQTDRVSEATTFLEGVAAVAPRRPTIQQGLAARYTRLDRYDDAEVLLLATARRITKPAAWLAVADLRLTRRDLVGAVEAVDQAVELATGLRSDDPALDWSRMTPESRFGLADVYIRARKFEPADRIIETFEDEPAFGLLLRARVRLERGDPAGALEDYQEAFRGFPSNPAGRYLAGRAALEVGDFDLAVEMYQDALRSDSTATDAGLILARMLSAEGRTNRAIDVLGFYLVANIDEPHGIRLMAQAGAASGRHGWAESVRAKLSHNPLWAGIALADQANDIGFLRGPEAAKEFLAKSPALDDPANFEAFSTWVAYASAAGEEGEARERASALTQQHPDSAGSWIVRSRIQYEDGNKSEAIEAIRRAIELNPMVATASAELGEMLLADGRIDEAIAAFDRAEEIDPLDARAAISAARGLLDAERDEEAEVRLRETLIQHPWHARAALMLVELLQEHEGQGVVDEWTYQLARRAARYAGVSVPRAYLVLAEIELERGDADEAVRHYEMAIKAKYKIADAQHGLAKGLVALDRLAEARVILEAALTLEDLADPIVASALLEEIRVEKEGP